MQLWHKILLATVSTIVVVAGSLGISFGVAKSNPHTAAIKPKMQDAIDNWKDLVLPSVSEVMPDYVFDLNENDSRMAIIKTGLKLPINSEVQIIVDENPTTGYSWQIDQASTKGLFDIATKYNRQDNVTAPS